MSINHESHKFLIVILSLLMMISISCETILDFKGKDIKPKIVLYSIVIPDSVITVRLGSSMPVFDPDFKAPKLNNAEVKLFINDGFVETLQYVGSTHGDYNRTYSFEEFRSGMKVSPRNNYRIEVKSPGYESVSSDCILPDTVEIISIDTISTFTQPDPSMQDMPSWRVLNCKLKFRDPPDTENYYRLYASYMAGYYASDKSQPYSPEYPVYVENYVLWRVGGQDPIINTKQDEGFFEDQIYNEYSIFTDELISGKEYILKFSLPVFRGSMGSMDTAYHEFAHYHIELQSISKELYLYLRSSSAHQMKEGNFFSEPVLVYGNVDNGLGVFGGSFAASRDLKIGAYPVDGVNYRYSSYDY